MARRSSAATLKSEREKLINRKVLDAAKKKSPSFFNCLKTLARIPDCVTRLIASGIIGKFPGNEEESSANKRIDQMIIKRPTGSLTDPVTAV